MTPTPTIIADSTAMTHQGEKNDASNIPEPRKTTESPAQLILHFIERPPRDSTVYARRLFSVKFDSFFFRDSGQMSKKDGF